MAYDFSRIERKWQKVWQAKKLYEPEGLKPAPKGRGSPRSARRPFYNLMMFPYPSAEGLHVGNVYAFTGADIYGRYKRMQGYDVFEPIGLDGFGIHSENYALKIGVHPLKQSKVSEKRFYKQLQIIGNGFAWDERLETYDPAYYKWTQWIFTQMFKHGLAYRKKQPVNWCPSCKTVLADEQVISGKCERCGNRVVKKDLEQWFFRITKYADKLLRNLEKLDWSEKVKIAQRNWIGQSHGAEITFPVGANRNYVLLHGFKGTNRGVFFPWLTSQLKKRGFKVFAPNLPHPAAPLEAEQVSYVLKHAKFNKNTILFGHSLGAVVAMKVAERLKRPIAGLVLAGGFVSTDFRDHPRPFDKTFRWRFDFKKIKKNTGFVKILSDLNDYAIPPEQGRRINARLGGEIIETIGQKEHFTAKEEPEIFEALAPQIKVFTTRPDTLFGATYMVLAPEHSLIASSKSQKANWKEVDRYIKKAKAKSEEERIAETKDKTGVELRGIKAVNPATKKEIPIWVADYVLSSYGTGAIMAVPAHDERDHEFAKKYGLPVVDVINGGNGGLWEGEGKLINSGEFTGTDSEKAKWEITKFVGGRRETHYRLRDWLISRQRYWGPPIPMIHCEICGKKGRGERKEMPGWYMVPEKNLPVKLPFVKDFRPRGKGHSPLASVKSFYETKCPACGGKARRETDVSDTFLDSAWYYLRYPSTHSARSGQVPWESKITKKWLPVDMYIGGAEHSVLHLLYVRFLALALHDMRLLRFGKGRLPRGAAAALYGEPFPKFRAHGLLIKEGAKMSKSRGNVVNPDEYIKKFGADVLRMYLMFLAPFEQGGDFRDAGVLGIGRFLERVWKFSTGPKSAKAGPQVEKALHRAIRKVGTDIENLRYNTAISALMILLNEMEAEAGSVSREQWLRFLQLLAPFAPHLAEELWAAGSGRGSVHLSAWPKYEEKMLLADNLELVIQVNGKVRDTLEIDADAGEEEVKHAALQRERIRKFLGGAEPKRVIYVPRRLINFVL